MVVWQYVEYGECGNMVGRNRHQLSQIVISPTCSLPSHDFGRLSPSFFSTLSSIFIPFSTMVLRYLLWIFYFFSSTSSCEFSSLPLRSIRFTNVPNEHFLIASSASLLPSDRLVMFTCFTVFLSTSVLISALLVMFLVFLRLRLMEPAPSCGLICSADYEDQVRRTTEWESLQVSGLGQEVSVLQQLLSRSVWYLMSIQIYSQFSCFSCFYSYFQSSGMSSSSLPKVALLGRMSGSYEQFRFLSFCLRSISTIVSSFSISPMVVLVDLSSSYFSTSRYFSALMQSSRYLFLQYSWWYLSRTRQLTDSLLSLTMRFIWSSRPRIIYLRQRYIYAIISSQVALSSLLFYLKISLATSQMTLQLEMASLSTVMLREAMSFWNYRQRLRACSGRESESMNLWLLYSGSNSAHLSHSSWVRLRSTMVASLWCLSQYLPYMNKFNLLADADLNQLPPTLLPSHGQIIPSQLVQSSIFHCCNTQTIRLEYIVSALAKVFG